MGEEALLYAQTIAEKREARNARARLGAGGLKGSFCETAGTEKRSRGEKDVVCRRFRDK